MQECLELLHLSRDTRQAPLGVSTIHYSSLLVGVTNIDIECNADNTGKLTAISFGRLKSSFKCTLLIIIRVLYHIIHIYVGHAVAQLVETLRYKPEGRGFDSRWCHWNFLLT